MKHISSVLKKFWGKESELKPQSYLLKGNDCYNVGTVVLGETSVSVKTLYTQYTPSYSNRYKEAVWRRVQETFGDSMKDGSMGDIGIKRVCFRNCDGKVGDLSYPTEISQVPYFFDYRPSDGTTKRWYLNFADPSLFVACNGSLFAQDEIQTLEHPLLCAVHDDCLRNAIAEFGKLVNLFTENEIKFVECIADYLYKNGYQWGESDGN